MDSTEDLDQEIIPKSSRRLAPMPRRARAEEGADKGETPMHKGADSVPRDMAGRTDASEEDLSRAADELLEHFDQATSLGDHGTPHRRRTSRTGGDAKDRRIVLGNRGLHEDGSESSGGGEIELKIAGLMTPDELAFKAGSSEDDGVDAYREPDWLPPVTATTTTTSTGSRREHDCEHDGCYGLTARFIDDDRLSDDYAARGGGKKRKVPASAQQGPTQTGDREETTCVHSCGHVCNEATTTSIIDSMNRQPSDHDEHEDTTHDLPSCPHIRCCNHLSTIRIVPDPVIKVPKRRMTAARIANDFERRLFHARKAQVLGLHADAVTCLGQSKQKNGAATVPSKDELEELVKALEYTGVAGWEGDRVGSGAGAGAGAGMWDGHVLQGRIQNGTLTATSGSTASATITTSDPVDTTHQPETRKAPARLKWRKRGRTAERHDWRSRPPIKRGGWVPEGTFEFEIPSKVSATVRQSALNLNMLRAKVTQLLTLTLSSSSMTSFLSGKPMPPVPPPSNTQPKANSPAAKRTAAKEEPSGKSSTRKREPLSAEKVHHANGAHGDATDKSNNLDTNQPTLETPEPKKDPSDRSRSNERIHNPPNVTVEPSADDPDYVPFSNAAGAKKGKKKKKKSAMANAANPHHVKNYVPSRRPVNPPQADMPNLVDFLSMLFFPPPTRFLNVKPGRKGAPESAEARRRDTPARSTADQTDEEYVCCFCEYDLFFGSEQAMDKAVRRRKKVLDRRQKAQEKAKGVMAGKGLRSKTKSAGDGGDSEDDERCTGGEKCRCAEIRAQEGREQSDDADSRGIEDTGSDEGEDDSGWVGHVEADDTDHPPRNPDPSRQEDDSGWVGRVEGDDDADHAPPDSARGGGREPTPPLRHESATPLSTDCAEETRRALPEVETFDLDGVDA